MKIGWFLNWFRRISWVIWIGYPMGPVFSEQPDTLTKDSFFNALFLAYFTPEAKISLDGFAFYNYKAQKTDRKSTIRLFPTHTQNVQFLLIFSRQLYTNREKYIFDGRIDFRFGISIPPAPNGFYNFFADAFKKISDDSF